MEAALVCIEYRVVAAGSGSKLKHQGMDRRFQSMFPFTRVPFWVPIFDPQPAFEICGSVFFGGTSHVLKTVIF